MTDEPIRLRLELNIEDRASAIDILKPAAAWLDDPEWVAFQKACDELLHYYEEQGDTVIGPLALGGYADFTRLLRKVLLSGELDEQQYEHIEEELITLEGWMDMVRRETMTNLRYQHPELNI